jgi:hypothetical protein
MRSEEVLAEGMRFEHLNSFSYAREFFKLVQISSSGAPGIQTFAANVHEERRTLSAKMIPSTHRPECPRPNWPLEKFWRNEMRSFSPKAQAFEFIGAP